MGMLREREQEPRCRTIQSQAERRDRGQAEESWLLLEGIDMFLYDLHAKIKNIIISSVQIHVEVSASGTGQNTPGYQPSVRWP